MRTGAASPARRPGGAGTGTVIPKSEGRLSARVDYNGDGKANIIDIYRKRVKFLLFKEPKSAALRVFNGVCRAFTVPIPMGKPKPQPQMSADFRGWAQKIRAYPRHPRPKFF
jgi:hypothetical protein